MQSAGAKESEQSYLTSCAPSKRDRILDLAGAWRFRTQSDPRNELQGQRSSDREDSTQAAVEAAENLLASRNTDFIRVREHKERTEQSAQERLSLLEELLTDASAAARSARTEQEAQNIAALGASERAHTEKKCLAAAIHREKALRALAADVLCEAQRWHPESAEAWRRRLNPVSDVTPSYCTYSDSASAQEAQNSFQNPWERPEWLDDVLGGERAVLAKKAELRLAALRASLSKLQEENIRLRQRCGQLSRASDEGSIVHDTNQQALQHARRVKILQQEKGHLEDELRERKKQCQQLEAKVLMLHRHLSSASKKCGAISRGDAGADLVEAEQTQQRSLDVPASSKVKHRGRSSSGPRRCNTITGNNCTKVRSRGTAAVKAPDTYPQSSVWASAVSLRDRKPKIASRTAQ
eukprot:gnl/MRDRNA2_/MRDRNA2_144570_c0_seq1.p1 gnl/MRDRNA2_/MRDRNA2_144570_c0~~gnl/MRDRNA2_/MRDRNA2_144570_c0_seq1.p1  ORF type:complete len:410 (+),score=93.74 gnl/MRDRNA2_/MRDRNA2_144570_c0_seq1:146-1375(+)